jgi:hypothetical protein
MHEFAAISISKSRQSIISHSLSFLFLLLNVVLASGFICIIWKYDLVPQPGDAINRILISINASHNVIGSFFNKGFFTSVWPPGHCFVQGIFVKLLLCCGISKICFIVKSIETFSILLIYSGIFLFYKSVKNMLGILAGTLTGIYLIGSPLVLYGNYEAMTRIYTFFFTGLSFWLMSHYLKNENILWLLLSSFIILLSSLFRLEMIVIIGAICLYLLLLKKPQHALVYGAIGFSYFASKIAYYVIYLRNEKYTFLNWGKHYDFGNNLSLARIEFSRFLTGFWGMEVAAYLKYYFFALCLILLILYLSKDRKIPFHIFNNKYFLFWALLALCYSCFISLSLLRGNINAQMRYSLFIAVFVGITISIIIALSLEDVNSKSTINILLSVIVILLLITISAKKNYHYGQNLMNFYSIKYGEERDIANWIEKHNKERVAVTYDTVFHHEMLIMLYLTEPNKKFISTTGWVGASVKSGKVPFGFSVFSRLHNHIIQYNSKYLVMSSDSYFKRIVKSSWHESSDEKYDSYFRPYMERISKVRYVLKSDFISNNKNIIFLTSVYRNKKYQVFAIGIEEV